MTKYMDRRTKKFKSFEKNVCELLKKELNIDAFRIASIEDFNDINTETSMLRILIKYKQQLVNNTTKEIITTECGRSILVDKELFKTVKNWSDVVLFNDDYLVLDINPAKVLLDKI